MILGANDLVLYVRASTEIKAPVLIMRLKVNSSSAYHVEIHRGGLSAAREHADRLGRMVKESVGSNRTVRASEFERAR